MAEENKIWEESHDAVMNLVHKIKTGVSYGLTVSCEHTEQRIMPFYVPGIQYIEVVASSMVNFDTISVEAIITDDMCYPIHWYEDNKLISNDMKISIESTHMNNFPAFIPNFSWLAFREIMDYIPQRKSIKCIRGTKQGEKERSFELCSYPNIKKEFKVSTTDGTLEKYLPGVYRTKNILDECLKNIARSSDDRLSVGFDASLALSGQWTEYTNYKVYYRIEGGLEISAALKLEIPYGIDTPRSLPSQVEFKLFIAFEIRIAGKIGISRMAPSDEHKSLEYSGGVEPSIGVVVGLVASLEVWSMKVNASATAFTSINFPIGLIGNSDDIRLTGTVFCPGVFAQVTIVLEGTLWDTTYSEQWQIISGWKMPSWTDISLIN